MAQAENKLASFESKLGWNFEAIDRNIVLQANLSNAMFSSDLQMKFKEFTSRNAINLRK